MMTLQATEATAMVDTTYWHALEDGRAQCDLCPRRCRLAEGQRGFCFVRANHDGRIVLTSYGQSSGLYVDPIEKKPLNHFYPGSRTLSFGTAGCNLACRFCQNWDISKSRETDTLNLYASPEGIARRAVATDCRSVAFTYNDPVIFMEYALDAACACHAAGVKTVAITAGYIEPEPRKEFFALMDAANVDLKAFSDRFYRKICGASLAPVLDTLTYLRETTAVWLVVTTLLIPGENDSSDELRNMARWAVQNLGPDVPWHFTAFHPDWKMLDHPATPAPTLHRARDIALDAGLRYVYVGNIFDESASSTYCHGCGQRIIGRNWYALTDWNLDSKGACTRCGTPLPGCFDAPRG